MWSHFGSEHNYEHNYEHNSDKHNSEHGKCFMKTDKIMCLVPHFINFVINPIALQKEHHKAFKTISFVSVCY